MCESWAQNFVQIASIHSVFTLGSKDRLRRLFSRNYYTSYAQDDRTRPERKPAKHTHTHTNNRKRVSSVLLEKKKGASNSQTKLSDQARDEWYGMIEGCTGVGENA